MLSLPLPILAFSRLRATPRSPRAAASRSCRSTLNVQRSTSVDSRLSLKDYFYGLSKYQKGASRPLLPPFAVRQTAPQAHQDQGGYCRRPCGTGRFQLCSSQAIAQHLPAPALGSGSPAPVAFYQRLRGSLRGTQWLPLRGFLYSLLSNLTSLAACWRRGVWGKSVYPERSRGAGFPPGG